MDDEIRRPRVATVYAWMVTVVPILFVLIAGFVGLSLGVDNDWIDIHRGLGELFGLLAIVVLAPMAFRAGPPLESRN